MKSNPIWITLLSLSLVLTGCSKDEQARADTELLNSITNSIVEAATSGGSDGVRLAQSILDERADDLRGAMTRLSSLRGFQVDDETQSLVEKSIIDCTSEINGLQLKLIRQVMNDKSLEDALDSLIGSYNSMLLES